MKNKISEIDGTPHKRFILSIVSDYDLNRSISELIDNATDIWIKNDRTKKLKIKINFDQHQKTIKIEDNSGGVKESELNFLISPGASSNTQDDNTIGIFGVGTKRAVIALSQDIKITTRYLKNKTYRIEFDEDWLQKEEEWLLPYYEVNEIEQGSTIIDLQKLRISIDEDDVYNLKSFISYTYAKFLDKSNFEILVDDINIKSKKYENWAYPKGYEPRDYSGILNLTSGRKVNVNVIAGLTTESSPASGEYGVYFYCNDRLIIKALKSPEVGFIKGIAGQPHPSLSISRVIVSLNGASIDMPWNSSKSDINTNHPVFKDLQKWLLEIVKNFTSLSRRLAGEWPETVFKYNTGEISKISVPDFNSTSKSYLLNLPTVNVKFIDVVKNKNANVSKSKPWTKGLYESIIAVDYISKQRIETKNRIALLMLDSALEISFKEFLVNDVTSKYYTDTDIQRIFAKRHLVVDEIKKYVSKKDITDIDWKKIKYYYDLRSKLVHERATVDITDNQLKDHREITEKVLKVLFKLKF
ncbi:ATP-binding protein [Flavobacterium celericrescens]|uniref:ATP-binding protein n=1 Tax=Flavobacterium celericrescens TaxID=2709780 RepID=A0ABX0IDM1_9FLAO|nr:ATP-binding protein [Flavobacterium celericrescens]NHM03792.1 ATP-binding protein [Flavobacterium celericrescens]